LVRRELSSASLRCRPKKRAHSPTPRRAAVDDEKLEDTLRSRFIHLGRAYRVFEGWEITLSGENA